MYRCERVLIKTVIVLGLKCLEERGYYAISPTYAKSGDDQGYRVAGSCFLSELDGVCDNESSFEKML